MPLMVQAYCGNINDLTDISSCLFQNMDSDQKSNESVGFVYLDGMLCLDLLVKYSSICKLCAKRKWT